MSIFKRGKKKQDLYKQYSFLREGALESKENFIDVLNFTKCGSYAELFKATKFGEFLILIEDTAMISETVKFALNNLVLVEGLNIHKGLRRLVHTTNYLCKLTDFSRRAMFPASVLPKSDTLSLDYCTSGLWHPEHLSILNFMLANSESGFKVMLEGGPGTGKTSIINLFAHSMGKNVQEVSSAELDGWDLASLRGNVNSIVVINDVDLVIPESGRKGDGVERGRMQKLLTTLDNSPNIVMTTNTINKIDKAILRPGRVNKIFKVDAYTDDENINLLRRQCLIEFLYDNDPTLSKYDCATIVDTAFDKGVMDWFIEMTPKHEAEAQTPAGYKTLINSALLDLKGLAANRGEVEVKLRYEGEIFKMSKMELKLHNIEDFFTKSETTLKSVVSQATAMGIVSNNVTIQDKEGVGIRPY